MQKSILLINKLLEFEEPEEWWGIDFDGTLATYDKWRGASHVGEPIAKTISFVQKLLSDGKKVKVFTARVATPENEEEAREAINTFCKKHIGVVLPITNEKDPGMVGLVDDKLDMRRVEQNTGVFVESISTFSLQELLEELSIAGVEITPTEKIESCAIRNVTTGGTILCDWHANGREEAWDKGWYAPVLSAIVEAGRRIPDSLRELYNMEDYEEVTRGVLEEGFMTTAGRFLSREDALNLARRVKQLNKNRLGASWDEEDPYLRSEEVSFST